MRKKVEEIRGAKHFPRRRFIGGRERPACPAVSAIWRFVHFLKSIESRDESWPTANSNQFFTFPLEHGQRFQRLSSEKRFGVFTRRDLSRLFFSTRRDILATFFWLSLPLNEYHPDSAFISLLQTLNSFFNQCRCLFWRLLKFPPFHTWNFLHFKHTCNWVYNLSWIICNTSVLKV